MGALFEFLQHAKYITISGLCTGNWLLLHAMLCPEILAWLAASYKKGISLKITSSERPSLTTCSPVLLASEHILSEVLFIYLLFIICLPSARVSSMRRGTLSFISCISKLTWGPQCLLKTLSRPPSSSICFIKVPCGTPPIPVIASLLNSALLGTSPFSSSLKGSLMCLKNSTGSQLDSLRTKS